VKFLLDTNVVSELRLDRCHPGVRARLDATHEGDLCISVITVGELAFGIARLEQGRRRQELEHWLEKTEFLFSDRLLGIDQSIGRLSGNLTAQAAARGRTLHTADGLIAATALRHGLHVMTRNVTDFIGTGVPIVNPWEDE
jgi:predicted nucleic acid-binding protein